MIALMRLLPFYRLRPTVLPLAQEGWVPFTLWSMQEILGVIDQLKAAVPKISRMSNWKNGALMEQFISPDKSSWDACWLVQQPPMTI